MRAKTAHSFYPPFKSKPFMANWLRFHMQFGRKPLPEHAAGDQFYVHAGRRPMGSNYTLFRTRDDQFVWIPQYVELQMDREEIHEWLETNQTPFCPWHMTNTGVELDRASKYLLQQFNRRPHSFKSFDEYVATVGPRPGPGWSLTKTLRPAQRNLPENRFLPLTAENFLWITEEAVKDAKAGKMNPPTFPTGTRSHEEQITNDARFRQYAQGMVDYALRRQVHKQRKDKIESDYNALLNKIAEYVIGKGYTWGDALNPAVFPENRKMRAARQHLSDLMEEYNMTPQQWTLRENNRRRKTAMAAMREKLRAGGYSTTNKKADPDLVYTGARGRPMRKMVKQKFKIADLTPEQRQSIGMDPADTSDFIRIRTRNTGRWTKKFTVELMVPNPKIQTANQPGQSGETPGQTP